MITPTTTVLAGEINIGMHNAHVPGESIAARKRLLVGAKCTAHLLLSSIVNGVLMTGEVIGT